MLGVYALVLLFIIITSISTSAQVKAIHFNAEWNEANDVEWFDKISDIKKERMDIGKGDCKDKYKITKMFFIKYLPRFYHLIKILIFALIILNNPHLFY